MTWLTIPSPVSFSFPHGLPCLQQVVYCAAHMMQSKLLRSCRREGLIEAELEEVAGMEAQLINLAVRAQLLAASQNTDSVSLP